MNGKELIKAIQKIPNWETREMVYDDREDGRESIDIVQETTFKIWNYIDEENYYKITPAIKLG